MESYAPWLLLVVAVVAAAMLYRWLRPGSRGSAGPGASPSEETEDEYLDSSHIIGRPVVRPPVPPRRDGEPGA